jgi:hypothetical protein
MLKGDAQQFSTKIPEEGHLGAVSRDACRLQRVPIAIFWVDFIISDLSRSDENLGSTLWAQVRTWLVYLPRPGSLKPTRPETSRSFLGWMQMFGSRGSPVSGSVGTGQNRGIVTKGILIFSGAALICLLAYFSLRGSNAKAPEAPKLKPSAELVSASSMILVQTPGKPGWREIKAGESLFKGDLVQTDDYGGAVIRYQSGATVSISRNTVFTVNGVENNRMEISASPAATDIPPLLLAGEKENSAADHKRMPFIELDRIIPFGRSLELIGRIEAGSSLMVNDERVEVSGDGSFKHFTSPFPAWAGTVTLNLKVRDLAGRTQVWTATHNFHPHGRED